MYAKIAIIGLILLIVTVTPAYALVTSLTLENDDYTSDESIVFSGIESEGRKMVRIDLYNPNGIFVNTFTDPLSEVDGSFTTIPKLVKSMFTTSGRYLATGYTDTTSKGITLLLYYDGERVIKLSTSVPEQNPATKIPDFIDPYRGAQYYLDRYYNEPAYKKWFDTNYPDYTIEEAIKLAIPDSNLEPKPKTGIPDFIDQKNGAEFYLNRYYNEPAYKKWFDTNYPDYTIEEAIALAIPSQNKVTIPSRTSITGCQETDECYLPYVLRINKFEEVTWFNSDTAAHTVTSGDPNNGPDGNNFDSSLFMAGTSFSYTFRNEGQFNYFCMVHPWMQGTVLVGNIQMEPIPRWGDNTQPTPQPPPSNSEVDHLREKIAQLEQENISLKMQIEKLQEQIAKLNELVMEQLKVIYDWVVSR